MRNEEKSSAAGAFPHEPIKYSPAHLATLTDAYHALESQARGLIKLLPVDAQGKPDLEAARRGEPLEEPPYKDDGPLDDEEAARWCVETLACVDMDDASRFVTLLDGDDFKIVQITGPVIDAHDLDVRIARQRGRSGPRLGPALLLPPVAANDNVSGGRFSFTWFHEIEEAQPKRPVVAGMLYAGEFTYVVGKPGSTKSIIATDLGFHVAARKSWHGHDVKGGLVIYFAAERAALTKRRVAALRKRYNVVENIPFIVATGKLDLTKNVTDAQELAAEIHKAESTAGERCVLIIIDTLSRTFGGADQHQSKDMGRFVASCDELGRQTAAHILVIHHSPWTEDRAKGAIDLDGAVDASFEVARMADRYILRCTGANDGAEGVLLQYKLESVALGEDPAGAPVTAPVVAPADAQKPAAVRTGPQRSALAALAAAIAENGVVPDLPAWPTGVVAVTEGEWREVFRKDQPQGSSADTTLKRFKRAVADLLDLKDVTQTGPWFFPAAKS